MINSPHIRWAVADPASREEALRTFSDLSWRLMCTPSVQEFLWFWLRRDLCPRVSGRYSCRYCRLRSPYRPRQWQRQIRYPWLWFFVCTFSLYHRERQIYLKHVLSLIPGIAAARIAHHRQGILLMHLRLGHPVRCEPVYLIKANSIRQHSITGVRRIQNAYLFGKSPPVYLQLEYLIQVLSNGGILLNAPDCWPVQQPLPRHLPYLLVIDPIHKQKWVKTTRNSTQQ